MVALVAFAQEPETKDLDVIGPCGPIISTTAGGGIIGQSEAEGVILRTRIIEAKGKYSMGIGALR